MNQNKIMSNIQLNEHLLALCKVCQILSIDIDKILSWNNQIEVLSSRTNRILSKLRYYIPTETLTSVWSFLFLHFIWFDNFLLYFSNKCYEDFHSPKKMYETSSEFQEHTPIFKNFKILELQDKFNTLRLIYLYYMY